MTRSRTLLLAALLLLLFASWWLWRNRPSRVDMTAYVPADALLYVEANDLPRVATAVTSTGAWHALAAATKLDFNASRFSLLSAFAARTGIGTAEAVVLARAQIAVVVLGINSPDADRSAASIGSDSLTLRPRLALVAETHTSTRRARHAIDEIGGELARRVYGSAHLATREADGVRWATWTPEHQSGEERKRQIVTAVTGSVAILGNDEAAVETCLAVRRGERPSLHGDFDLNEMRRRTRALHTEGDAGGEPALAFGYISPANAVKLLEIGATVYAAQSTLSPQAQGAAATLLPQVLPRVVGSVAWSARADEDRIEDRFFFSVKDAVAARLRDPLAAVELDPRFGELLPAETKSVSAYLYREPEAAWRGAQAALSSQLDFGLAPLLVLFADRALEPYGIPRSRDFLRQTSAPIATAQLDESNERLLIARVRDPQAMLALLRRRPGTQTETAGGHTLLIRTRPPASDAPADDTEASDDTEAAVIVGDHLIIGDRVGVRRCLDAQANGRTLRTTIAFRRAAEHFGGDVSDEMTSVAGFAHERAAVRDTVRLFTTLDHSSGTNGDGRRDAAARSDLSRALDEHAYATHETRLVDGGFERRTRSVFGLFGRLIRALNDDDGAE